MSLVGFRAQNHPQQTVRDDVDDRRTTPDLLAECAELAGVDSFDLDVAASEENAKAAQWFDVHANGLARPWVGNVWCNPPYSNVAAWVEKAWDEVTLNPLCGTVAMLLPANRTEQAWWQLHVEPHRDGRGLPLDVHFLAGRRRFERPGWTKPTKGDRPPFGLVLLVWKGLAS